MTELPEQVDEQSAGRGWLRWVTIAVGAFVVLLLVYLVLIIPTGTSLIPGKTTGDHREANIVALRRAADSQLTTFLNQNYRTSQASMTKLIAGSTGKFHDQLVGSSVTQITSAAQLKTVASGKIKKIAVTRLGPSSATLLAVATQTVTNTQTAKTKKSYKCAAGSVCNPFYLLLTYQRVDGQWKMSNLEFLTL
ncbi:MAG: hypothetical protein ACTHJM_09600 [Marmoricola sp.]